MNKLKIIDYYDDLKNQIDIECEQMISNEQLSNKVKEQCLLQRTSFLNEINQISNLNMENFEKIKWDNHFFIYKNVGSILFQDKFCLYISKEKTQNGDFKTDHLGKLVITNFFIGKDVQENLDFNNSKSKNYHELHPKDLVLLSVIDGLLRTNWPGKDGIIDISCKESNRISKLFLSAQNVKRFERDDFDCISHIILRENIEKCFLSFDSLKFITKKIINIFEFVNELTLQFDYLSEYDDELFSDFQDLDKLEVKFTNSYRYGNLHFPDDLFNGLKNLKELVFKNNSIGSIESNSFSNLSNLEILDLESNDLELLTKSCFKGLENLKILNLEGNQLRDYHIALAELKNLTCLHMNFPLATSSHIQFEHFNCLKSLQVLKVFKIMLDDFMFINMEDLDLPNLRFLGISSGIVPKFKHLKLNFLHITGLKEIDEISLNSQVDLTG
ncbi:unnamed protein product, partial [Brachionus calyciflorus]